MILTNVMKINLSLLHIEEDDTHAIDMDQQSSSTHSFDSDNSMLNE